MLLVKAYAIEVMKVEHQPAMSKCLTAHAVLLSGTTRLQLVLAGELQSSSDIVLAGDADYAIDFCFVEVAGVIGKSPNLLEGDGSNLWFRNHHRRPVLAFTGGENKIAVFIAGWGRGILENLSDRRCDKHGGC